MQQGTVLDPPRRYTFAIPVGAHMDPQAEHLDVMMRHLNLGTYTMPLFLADLYKAPRERVITPLTISLHLQCVRVGESKTLGQRLSDERILEMIREIQHADDDLANVDEAVLKVIGL